MSDAYQAGRDAYCDGSRYSRNPYSPETAYDLWGDWSDGWLDAEDEETEEEDRWL